jgi:hypothetical protein
MIRGPLLWPGANNPPVAKAAQADRSCCLMSSSSAGCRAYIGAVVYRGSNARRPPCHVTWSHDGMDQIDFTAPAIGDVGQYDRVGDEASLF